MSPRWVYLSAHRFDHEGRVFRYLNDGDGVYSHAGKSLMDQVKDTMLFTVWVFIGIEGAVIVSGRAKSQREEIGRAHV